MTLVLPRTYDGQVCSIARALELVGDRWTMLVIREAFMGTRRFDDFQRNLGCARNVLTDRLGRLVEVGILRRTPTRSARSATSTASPARAWSCGRR